MQYKKVVCRLLSLYTFTEAQFLQIKGSELERVDEALKSLELLAKDQGSGVGVLPGNVFPTSSPYFNTQYLLWLGLQHLPWNLDN